MRRCHGWMFVACFSLVLACAAVPRAIAQTTAEQTEEIARAKQLSREGKKLDALPLYEDLVKAFPKEWLYYEQLADCLGAKEQQSTDPAEIKAIRTRIRDLAKRAVELGDPYAFTKAMAEMDPDASGVIAPASPGSAALQAAEKAFNIGDFRAAFIKYVEAANADSKLYEAPLFAGDTAYRQKDLKTASIWFQRAIDVDPDRETAYRYWGDAMLSLGGDPMEAKEKFLQALVAEPYSRYSWQGIQQWAKAQKVDLSSPKIDRPAGPVTDPKKPNNITINIDPGATDDKKHPGASAWLMYSLIRASYRGDQFKKNFPNEKDYRHSLKEEDAALSAVVASVNEKKIKPEKLDESLRNLVELDKAGMLDCWILINGADQGIAQDYDAYRKDHRQLLHDYLDRFVVHSAPHAGE